MNSRLPEPFRTEIAAIAADTRSGAAALAGRATQALLALAEDWRDPAFTGMAEAAALAVAVAQPAMAPLFRLANDALWAASDRDEFLNACLSFRERLGSSDEAIAQHAYPLISGSAHILTHSFSRTVLRALMAARRRGATFRVIATESRPLAEGIALARELAASGIEVAVIIDAAAGRFADRADVVMSGADCITTNTVVNKVGSELIALAAARRGKPVYALSSSLKIAPPGFALRESPRPAAEIVPHPSGFEVWNFYFEAIPLDLFAGVVTEDGILSPRDIEAKSAAIHLHPALKAVLTNGGLKQT